jgi:cytosine/uracil/thiamine/allantoin permease
MKYGNFLLWMCLFLLLGALSALTVALIRGSINAGAFLAASAVWLVLYMFAAWVVNKALETYTALKTKKEESDADSETE